MAIPARRVDSVKEIPFNESDFPNWLPVVHFGTIFPLPKGSFGGDKNKSAVIGALIAACAQGGGWQPISALVLMRMLMEMGCFNLLETDIFTAILEMWEKDNLIKIYHCQNGWYNMMYFVLTPETVGTALSTKGPIK